MLNLCSKSFIYENYLFIYFLFNSPIATVLSKKRRISHSTSSIRNIFSLIYFCSSHHLKSRHHNSYICELGLDLYYILLDERQIDARHLCAREFLYWTRPLCLSLDRVWPWQEVNSTFQNTFGLCICLPASPIVFKKSFWGQDKIFK